MANKTYKKIEIVGTSDQGLEDAIQSGLAKASASLHNIDWFEVAEIRGAVAGGKPVYQVTMKVGFRLDE